MPAQMTKSQLIEKIAENTELGKKDVKAVIESMVATRSSRRPAFFSYPGLRNSSLSRNRPPKNGRESIRSRKNLPSLRPDRLERSSGHAR